MKNLTLGDSMRTHSWIYLLNAPDLYNTEMQKMLIKQYDSLLETGFSKTSLL